MVKDLLKQLIAIPALNPEDTHDPALVGEARMATFLQSFFQERGCKVDLLEVDDGRPNLVARLGRVDAPASLMIEGHMDTVGIEGMTIDPFVAVEKQGRIYGRGASDPRGGIAAALSAFSPERIERLNESGKQVLFVGSVGEEKACQGAVQLAKAGVGAREALVLEPTELVPVIAHKGPLWFEVEIEGRSAHASSPTLGLNAIEAMMEFIGRLNRLHENDVRHEHDPFLGSPTLSIGMIQGGQAPNIVPDRCRIKVDRRNVPGEDVEEILQRIRMQLVDMQHKKKIISYELNAEVSQPSFYTAPDSPLVTRMQRVRQAHGLPVEAVGTPWFSDAGPLAATCRDIMVFGPGSIAQAHTRDEYIEVAELEQGARMMQDFLDAFIEEPE